MANIPLSVVHVKGTYRLPETVSCNWTRVNFIAINISYRHHRPRYPVSLEATIEKRDTLKSPVFGKCQETTWNIET